jgi:hypothetical protein
MIALAMLVALECERSIIRAIYFNCISVNEFEKAEKTVKLVESWLKLI